MIDPLSAIRLSLLVATFATLAGLPPAVGVGWLLARRSFAGKSLLSALLMAPLVLPPVVTGLLLLRAFGHDTLAGKALAAVDLPVPFTLFGAMIAAWVVGFPLMVLSARTAFESVDPRFESVSAALGVRPLRTFWRTTLPLAAPGLCAGAVLTFARALGEFGATAIVAGNMEGRTRTIALAVYSLLDEPNGEPQIRVLLVASLTISVAALYGWERLNRWQRRRLDVAHG